MTGIINSMIGGPELPLGFSGGTYCFYMLCGYLAKRGLFKPVKTGWLIAVVICCIKHAKFLKELASYSFAVYLVHVIIRLLLLEWILSLPIIRPVKVIIFWLITLVLSYAAAWPISKIPKIGNHLIYRK